eukprot:620544-Rhodomonas_salina.1
MAYLSPRRLLRPTASFTSSQVRPCQCLPFPFLHAVLRLRFARQGRGLKTQRGLAGAVVLLFLFLFLGVTFSLVTYAVAMKVIVWESLSMKDALTQ